MAEYGFGIERWPAVLGSDVAGEIVEKGTGVTKFEVGDIVFGLGMTPVYGSYAEYCIVEEEMAVKVPQNITPEQAAAFPVAIYTGFLAAFSSIGFGLPTTGPRNVEESFILVWGGASATGMSAIQLYSALGYQVITTASPQHHDYLRSLGAHHVFNYRDENVVEQIKAVAIHGLRFGYDCVGDDKVVQSLSSEHPAHVAYITRQEVPALPQNVHGHIIFLGGVLSQAEIRTQLFKEAPPIIERLIIEGRLLPPNLEIFNGVDGVHDALKKQKQGVNAMKVIVKMI